MCVEVCPPSEPSAWGWMWSRSQDSTGLVQYGKTQWWSRSLTCEPDPVGDLIGVHRLVAGQVDHRPHDHRRVRQAEPFLDLLHADRGAGVPEPTHGLVGRRHMQDELGLPTTRDRAGDLPGVGVSHVEVEDQVLTRDLTQCLGTPDVQGVLIAELPVERGAAGDDLLEVEGVGNVEAGGAVGDAGGVNVVDPEVDVAVIGSGLASLLERLGVEPDQRLFDEPVDLRRCTRARRGRVAGPRTPRPRPGGGGCGRRSAAPSTRVPHRPTGVPQVSGGGGRAR